MRGPSVRVAFLALAVGVVAAAAPALAGGWVYDDRLMVGHPMLDGLEDILPAFGRTSDDFQAPTRSGPGIAGGSTYRPLPMVSFILVNGTLGPRPLAHHLVSLALHLAVVGLLLGFAAGGVGRVDWRALFVVTIFALHPSNLETYGWINARADAMAGVALAGVLALARRPRRWPWLLAVAIAGGLSKETFFPAAFALLVAWRLRPWQPRALLGDVAVIVGAAGAVLGLRLATGAGLAAGAGGTSLASLAGLVPRVVGLAVETWVVPLPHAMRLLAWETSQPFPMSQVVAALVPLIAIAAFVWKGELRRAALVAGALATLAPVVLVAGSFWLGFDRYLYLPAILVAAAALPLAGGGRGWALGVVVAAAGLGFATHVDAGAYRSHTEFALAILGDRPDEPTGYLLAADDALDGRRPADAAMILDQLPADPDGDWPPSVAHHAAALLLRLGRGAAATELVERAAAAHPDDANLRFDLLTVRAAQHRWPEVVTLARGLVGDQARRRAIGDLVEGWTHAGQIPPGIQTELRDLLLRPREP